MKIMTTGLAGLAIGAFSATSALADCSGGFGRGWASGKGNGAFEMQAADKACTMGFTGFGGGNSERIPATEIRLTTAPKSGKLGVSAKGMVYTPNPGFKGKDKFCTRNTSAKVKGETLSGCVTVTVK
ncbi:hypothetical protein EEB11_13800 [Pseudotabrizicola sediminis]|uniref:Uncharacterized protein n=1 Tax=Pseudotabrizicola sediminis TaxID=2486418 RepID=A0ABY2KJ15_9RHOB|nr:hypothetical protein [Pseudotabrizicola sediminis]TGD42362.1 hypothetical protein EEB11_13800 [Pseudotabrizicola sediminis]